MNLKEFKELVREALEDLPEVFRKKLENVAIVVEDKPTKSELKGLKTDNREIILGLYHGVPLLERTHQYGMVMPDKISIYKKNIEAVCERHKGAMALRRHRTDEEIKRMVTDTVKHEIAHHFGMTDQEMREHGVY